MGDLVVAMKFLLQRSISEPGSYNQHHVDHNSGHNNRNLNHKNRHHSENMDNSNNNNNNNNSSNNNLNNKSNNNNKKNKNSNSNNNNNRDITGLEHINTFDAIKCKQWLLSKVRNPRRAGLSEDLLQKDFERIQEKILLEESNIY